MCNNSQFKCIALFWGTKNIHKTQNRNSNMSQHNYSCWVVCDKYIDVTGRVRLSMKCCWTVTGALLQPGTSPTHYTAPISGFNGAQCSLSVSEPQASYRPSIVPMSPKINKVSSHLTATWQRGLSAATERCSTVSTTDRKKEKWLRETQA